MAAQTIYDLLTGPEAGRFYNELRLVFSLYRHQANVDMNRWLSEDNWHYMASEFCRQHGIWLGYSLLVAIDRYKATSTSKDLTQRPYWGLDTLINQMEPLNQGNGAAVWQMMVDGLIRDVGSTFWRRAAFALLRRPPILSVRDHSTGRIVDVSDERLCREGIQWELRTFPMEPIMGLADWFKRMYVGNSSVQEAFARLPAFASEFIESKAHDNHKLGRMNEPYPASLGELLPV